MLQKDCTLQKIMYSLDFCQLVWKGSKSSVLSFD